MSTVIGYKSVLANPRPIANARESAPAPVAWFLCTGPAVAITMIAATPALPRDRSSPPVSSRIQIRTTMRRLLLSRFSLLFAAALACSQVQAADGWHALFDGTSTDSFRNYQKDSISDGWKIVDGALVKTRQGAGDILTKKKYAAFELELEFKISKAGNSGIMYHVTEDNAKPWHSGAEIQIQDNVDGHDPQKCGWLYQLYSTDVDATKPAGQWNKLRIVISPKKCEHYMNGTKYVEYVKGSKDWDAKVAASKFSKFENFGKATEGHLCFQDHGDEVAYRNIRIRELK